MNADRVLSRYLQADLSPPLGKPGGPCQVVQRIDQSVRNPALKHELVEDVERGVDLQNQDAAKVYPLDLEPGVGGLFRQIRIRSHAQYRMDLRSVTVKDVQKALSSLLQNMGEWKVKRDRRYDEMLRAIQTGTLINWVSPRDLLFVAFDVSGGVVNLITTYWKGEEDPGPSHCP